MKIIAITIAMKKFVRFRVNYTAKAKTQIFPTNKIRLLA